MSYQLNIGKTLVKHQLKLSVKHLVLVSIYLFLYEGE